MGVEAFHASATGMVSFHTGNTVGITEYFIEDGGADDGRFGLKASNGHYKDTVGPDVGEGIVLWFDGIYPYLENI